MNGFVRNLKYFMEGRPFSDQILSDGLLASWQGSVSIHEPRQGSLCNRANAQFKSKNSRRLQKTTCRCTITACISVWLRTACKLC